MDPLAQARLRMIGPLAVEVASRTEYDTNSLP